MCPSSPKIFAMLSSARSRAPSLAARITRASVRPLSISSPLRTGENFNNPLPQKETPNVSKTNELAVDAMGTQGKSLQELESDAEKLRQLQAPNRKGIWSRSQMPREAAMTGPRFEQTIMETQVSVAYASALRY
jgi:NADH dehydrogenase (ubiquinone) Fe-S protein 6